jgi:hypothetical protein
MIRFCHAVRRRREALPTPDVIQQSSNHPVRLEVLMRRLRTVPLLPAFLLFVGVPAAASAPVRSSGTIQLGPPTVVSEQTHGPVVIDEQQGTAWFAGAIDSGAAGGTLMIKEIVHPNGTATDLGTWTGTATVGGTTGPLTLKIVGNDDGSTSSGHLVARGSGALADLHGSGTFSVSDTTGAGSYTFDYSTS